MIGSERRPQISDEARKAIDAYDGPVTVCKPGATTEPAMVGWKARAISKRLESARRGALRASLMNPGKGT